MFEWESESEAAERAPIRRPSSQSSFKPRPAPGAPNAVTQAQLEAALARVDGKIKTVADSVSTIHSRLNSLAVSGKKEAEERKKGLDGQNKDLNQKLRMLALLPLLVQSPTASNPNVGGVNLTDGSGAAITSITTPDSNNLDAILPLLLVSGLGDSSGGGLGFGDGGGGSDSSMMLLALVLAFSNKN